MSQGYQEVEISRAEAGNPPSNRILGTRVDVGDYSLAVRNVLNWVRRRERKYVAVANVHMIMEGYDNEDFRGIINRSGFVTADGMPLVWALRLLGFRAAERVYGPTLTLHLCQAAQEQGIPVGFYGGRPEVLESMLHRIKQKFPDLKINYCWSPPFKPLNENEAKEQIERINASGVGILFVGLGCPKQECWMHRYSDRIAPVMLGVGAAFDFHAGAVRQSPAWLQRLGLEWLFRFAMEPRRLWKRYLKHNPRFIALFLLQLIGLRRF